MIGEHDYIICFMDRANGGQFWGIGTNGDVVLSANPYLLRFAPAGWQDISVQNIRNKRYFGSDRSVTVPLAYVEDGARILKHIMYTYGPEAAPVYMKLGRYLIDYTGADFSAYYKLTFTGEIDLYSFSHAAEKVTVKALEDGIAKHLKANEKTIYEIPMDTQQALWVKDDGINLLSTKTFSTVDEGVTINVGGIGQTSRTRYYYLTYLHVQAEGTNVNLVGKDITLDPNGFVNIDWTTSDQYFLEATAATTINVKISLPVVYRSFAPASGTGHARVLVVNNSGTTVHTAWQNYHSGPMLQTAVIDTSFTYAMAAGEKLFFVLELNIAKASLDGNAYPTFFSTKDSTHRYGYKNRYKATYIRALRPQYVFDQLVDKVTGGKYQAAVSPYLGSIMDRVLRSGDAIRGLESPMLKISLDTFFEWCDCRDGVGIGLDSSGKLLMAKKQGFVDPNSVIALTGLTDVQVGIDTDLPFNQIDIGYPEFRNDVGALNGNNEFNCRFSFATTGMKAVKTISKVSPVKASCYEQENIRVILSGKDSTDNKGDNDVYVVHISQTMVAGADTIPDHYTIDRSANAFITGVIEAESIYNVLESPRRMLLQNGAYLRSCHYKGDTLNFRFASADKNSSMVYNDGTVLLQEKGDINIGSLDAPFFTPILISFTCITPDDLLERLDAAPASVFGFDIDGQPYVGIPLKEGTNPETGKEQAVQMWSAPSNDLTKLIEYYGE